MSGKRQHFIPQFLQKGFASHTEDEEVYTWVFRKKREPFNTNLINIGVEKYFYTDQSDSIADDKITEAEHSYSELINNLRTQPFGPVSDSLIPEFIAHLEVRTRHLRQSFLEMSNYVVDRLLEFISNEEKFFVYVLQEIKDEKSLIHKDFIEEFEKHGFPKKAVKDWIKSEPKKVALLLNHLKPIFPSIAKNYKRILSSENVSKWIKTGHVNILKKTISPDIRISIYKKMNYSIKELPRDNLILGDSAVLFQVNGKKRYKTFIDKEDKVIAILLPLSPKRLLIGRVDERGINYGELQTKIASNSLEYFIASNKNEKILSLQKIIGKEAHLLAEDEIEELVKETFTGYDNFIKK